MRMVSASRKAGLGVLMIAIVLMTVSTGLRADATHTGKVTVVADPNPEQIFYQNLSGVSQPVLVTLCGVSGGNSG